MILGRGYQEVGATLGEGESSCIGEIGKTEKRKHGYFKRCVLLLWQ